MSKKSPAGNEWDDHRARQEIAKDAELKAKLAMVELKDKPSYGRQPRKIGEMICDTGIKTGYRNATCSFVLRLNEKEGLFIAEHGDFWYTSKSREALQAKMDEVAKVTLNLEWTRYLHIKYEATVPATRSWMGGTTTLEVDEGRDDKTEILGIELKWDVVEYSNAIHLPGDDGERFMKREVDDDGESSTTQETVKSLPAGLVPHTKAREELLRQFRDALTTIDAKMVKLLRGSPEAIAKRLDLSNGTLLLAAPKVKS